MATEKIIGFKLELTGSQKTASELNKVEAELKNLSKELRDTQKQYDAAFNAKDAERIADYDKKLVRLRESQASLKRTAGDLRKELKDQQREFEVSKSAEGSYERLNLELGRLRKQYKALSEDEKNADIGGTLLKRINELDVRLKDEDAKLGVFARNVGDYENSIVRAFERVGTEESLEKRLQSLKEENEKLIRSNRELEESYGKVASVELNDKIVKQLAAQRRQVEENNKAIKLLSSDQEKIGRGGISGRTAGRAAKAAGRLLGGAGQAIGNVASSFGGGADAAGQFGKAGVAAFAVFAAGGLLFKGLQGLEQLSKEFNALSGKVQAFSGVTGDALNGIVSDTKAIATTFGKETDDVLNTTKALVDNLGGDFQGTLGALESGLLSAADANGTLLSNLEELAPEAQKAGLSINELIAVSAKSAESGIFSADGARLITNFGTAVKQNSEEARSALEGAFGEDFTNNLFQNLQNGAITTTDAVELVAQELNKTGVSSEEAAKVIQSAFGGEVTKQNEDFLRSLTNINTDLNSYIDTSNRLTRQQQAALQANKALAEAQTELGNVFSDTGISLENIGTNIKATLLNAATSVVNFFDRTFGDGVEAALSDVRQANKAFEDQKAKVESLQKSYIPLVDRYDALQKELETATPGTEEYTRIQEELDAVTKQIIKDVPVAASAWDEYGNVIAINTQQVREFVGVEQQGLENLRRAQFETTRDALATLRQEFQDAQQVIQTGTVEGFFYDSKATNADLLESAQRVKELGAKIAELEGALGKDELGREFLAAEKAVAAFNKTLAETGDIQKANEAATRARLANTKSVLSNALDINKALTAQLEAAKPQLESATAANLEALEEERKAASERAKQRAEERKALIEGELQSQEQYRAAIREANIEVEKLRIDAIQNTAERERAQIELEARLNIETLRAGLEQQGEERIKALEELKNAAGSDAVIRAQFGTPAEIQARIEAVNAEIQKAIGDQTALIEQARDKQISDLQKSNEAARKAALGAIDAASLQSDLNEVQRAVEKRGTQVSTLSLQLQLDTSKIEGEFVLAKANLDQLLANNLIAQEDYNTSLEALELQKNARLLEADTAFYRQSQALQVEQLDFEKQQIDLELQQRIAALDAETAAQIEQQKKLQEEGILTESETATAIAQIEQEAQAARLAESEAAAARKIELGLELQNEELDQLGELAQREIDLNAQTQEAIRAERQRTLDELVEGLTTFQDLTSQFSSAVLTAFEANDNIQKQKIEERYDRELQRAQGNSARIAEIERKKQKELDDIDKSAGERKKAVALTEAAINGALAVTKILAETPDPSGVLTAIRIAAAVATTAAQIALIASQSFALGGEIPDGDGMVSGRSHAQGGVKFATSAGVMEVEGGEFMATDETGSRVVINKNSTRQYGGLLRAISNRQFAGKRGVLEAINVAGGGRPFNTASTAPRFADGGLVAGVPTPIPAPALASNVEANNKAIELLSQTILQQNQLINALAANLQATNARFDRLEVVVDSRKVAIEADKQIETKQALTL